MNLFKKHVPATEDASAADGQKEIPENSAGGSQGPSAAEHSTMHPAGCSSRMMAGIFRRRSRAQATGTTFHPRASA